VVTDRQPWERLDREHARAYAAFRAFRDLGPTRRVEQAIELTVEARRTVMRWSSTFHWFDRAEAWDEECYRIEDSERLEAIRQMHRVHQRAGRGALMKGLRALEALPDSHVPAGAAARLVELGARLERSTLITSVAELQGIEPEPEEEGEDPWAVIARELEADSTAATG
jgi:hypothetical protein